MPRPPEVFSFKEETFFDLMRQDRLMTSAQAADHEVLTYLSGYLTEIGATTFVVEHDYIDRSYLDDYAQYYVRSFIDYGRHCRRLHFFAVPFAESELFEWIQDGPQARRLDEAYLGFIVARPLPLAVVGRTVLATYPPDRGRRHYPARMKCPANLFGHRLDVKSLPFQEQDTVLAACATVALWSALQRCADLFGTPAPSPAEITSLANIGGAQARTFPSRGLTVQQMCKAITAVGLEPEVFECSAVTPIASIAYAYLQSGLPVILLVEIDQDLHAIALTGFSLEATGQIPREDMAAVSPSIRRIGLRLSKFYGHDDQVGPFARLHIQAVPPDVDGEDPVIEFRGQWKSDDGEIEPLVPKHMIVPVYPKMRLTFLDIQRWIDALNRVLAQVVVDFDSFEWDVRLGFSNDYKAEMRSATDPALRLRVLLEAYPRFIWRATVRRNHEPVLELLFDATDMERSYPFLDLFFFDDTLGKELGRTLHTPNPPLQSALSDLITPQFLTFLQDHTPRPASP